MDRREWFKKTFAGLALLELPAAAWKRPGDSSAGLSARPEVAERAVEVPASREEIYRLLGFATMTGEDPRTMWARLKNTETWFAGPLAPDAWAGQVFIADHADIFAFRFLSLPSAWLAEYQPGKLGRFATDRFAKFRNSWPQWWRIVGPRAFDDSYARLVWQMPDGGPEVTYEWARTGLNQVVCRIVHSIPARLLIECYVPWDSAPPKLAVLYSESKERRFVRGRSWVPGTRDGMRWVLAMNATLEDSAGVGTCPYFGLTGEAKAFYLCGKQGQSYEALEEETGGLLDAGEIDRLLEKNRDAYLRRRPEGAGWLEGVPAAINDQLEWSEVYTPERKRTYITVSRGWSSAQNSAPDFLWDSFLSALLVCQEDEGKAFGCVRDITDWQNEQGMFCQYGQWLPRPEAQVFPVAWGHTQYPIGALATAKIYLRRPNREFLSEIYAKLLKNHRWWFADRGDGQPWRDGNRNGLLELGSNYPAEIPYGARQQVAYYESHDDSPQWWHVAAYNEQTNTVELDTVERNCLYTMDAHVLSWMARELGRVNEAEELSREHAVMAERINRLLWDASRNTYANRRWAPKDGNWFMPQMAPDIFFSLLGQIAPPDRAAALREIFHDPKRFAGEWILPTISRDDPAFPDQDYWRGKVWGPINWLVYQGFKIEEWDHEARLLAESSAKMFLKPWRGRAECHENFLSTTGEGSSDPHYTWGALMVLIGIEELIDINPWHGLRFGNLDPVADAGIERYFVAGSYYDVHQSLKHIEVRRDGRFLFEATGPVELRNVTFEAGRVTFEARTARKVRVRAGKGRMREYQPGLTEHTEEF